MYFVSNKYYFLIKVREREREKKKKKWASLVAQMQEFACNVGDLGLILGLGRSPGGGHGYPLQYSCLENSMNREALWATVHKVAKSQT